MKAQGNKEVVNEPVRDAEMTGHGIVTEQGREGSQRDGPNERHGSGRGLNQEDGDKMVLVLRIKETGVCATRAQCLRVVTDQF